MILTWFENFFRILGAFKYFRKGVGWRGLNNLQWQRVVTVRKLHIARKATLCSLHYTKFMD